MYSKTKGISLLEVILVVAIIAVLVSFFVPLGLDFYKNQQAQTYLQAILQTLRRAQSKSISMEQDSSFGVYFSSSRYILFKGSSYSTRESQFDEVFDLPNILTLSGLQEIVFLKLTGLPRQNPAFCEGVCRPCNQFSTRDSCRRQEDCNWRGQTNQCQGNCTSCSNFLEQDNCEEQLGCTWVLASIGGDINLNSDGKVQTININEIGRVNLPR